MYKLYELTPFGSYKYINTYYDLVILQIEAYRVFSDKILRAFDSLGNEVII